LNVENGGGAAAGVVDLHNHLMPGVDDGATNIEESRAALAAMRESGVETLVATPHLKGSLTHQPEALAARLAELDVGWESLQALGASEFPAMTLMRGVELMLDTPAPDLSDPRLRLGGGSFVLMEFPFMTVPPRSAHAISELRMQGWKPVIAHPERYAGLDPRLEVVGEWRRYGGVLQVNVGSILGRYGEEARERALALLERGWVDLLASDYHARGRLMVRSAIEWLNELGAADQARQLLMTNPRRLLAGDDPLPVAPLSAQRSIWSRIRKVFR
jgi:protein-tyrosine phosphatase